MLYFTSLWKTPCCLWFFHLRVVWTTLLATTLASSIPLELATLTTLGSLDMFANASTRALGCVLGFVIDFLGFASFFFTCAYKPTTCWNVFTAIMFYFHSSKYYSSICLHECLTMQGLSHNWSCKQLHLQIPHKLIANASISTTYPEVNGESRQLRTIANDWSWGAKRKLYKSSRDDKGRGIWKWSYSKVAKVYWGEINHVCYN